MCISSNKNKEKHILRENYCVLLKLIYLKDFLFQNFFEHNLIKVVELNFKN
jgi:hypothetical protein